MKRPSSQVLCLALALGFADVCFADAVFHLWFEAPSEVQAGSTFTLTAWAEVTGSILGESDGGFNSFGLDVVGSGLPAAFSNVQMPYFAALAPGTPDTNSMREIIGINLPEIGPFYTMNPIILFNVDVTLNSAETGEIVIAPSQIGWADFMLAWWVDYVAGTYVTDSDSGSSLIVTPATVRVIPAPAGVVILVLGELVRGGRRKRSSRYDPREVSLADGSHPCGQAWVDRCPTLR
ncbi:MAG: hypothetical protein DYG94_09535 [Leptolyngbya sp. PLA3]|nr:MAG: hypothetical protein EDM82_08160 [Cyanobacteria bacterium CYA]MCE7968970.1 hypothetical protein [Leptolyngbya sp. PL-A3]